MGARRSPGPRLATPVTSPAVGRARTPGVGGVGPRVVVAPGGRRRPQPCRASPPGDGAAEPPRASRPASAGRRRCARGRSGAPRAGAACVRPPGCGRPARPETRADHAPARALSSSWSRGAATLLGWGFSELNAGTPGRTRRGGRPEGRAGLAARARAPSPILRRICSSCNPRPPLWREARARPACTRACCASPEDAERSFPVLGAISSWRPPRPRSGLRRSLPQAPPRRVSAGGASGPSAAPDAWFPQRRLVVQGDWMRVRRSGVGAGSAALSLP